MNAHRFLRRLGAVLMVGALFTMVAAPAAQASPAPPPAAAAAVPAAAVAPLARPVPALGTGDVLCGIAGTAIFGPIGGLTGALGVCDKAGKVISNAVGSLFDTMVLSPITDDVNSAVASELQTMFTWWLNWPSVSVDSNDYGMAGLTKWIAGAVAIILLMQQGIRMIMRRKSAPLVEAIEGLLKFAFMAAVGETLLAMLLAGSDSLCDWIIRTGFTCPPLPQSCDNNTLAKGLAGAFAPGDGIATILLLIFGILAALMGIIQLILLVIRQSAIPIEACLLLIAASGQVGEANGRTRSWSPKLWASITGVVLYKPMAALVIVVGYKEIVTAKGLAAVITGFVTLLLSVFALPSMIKIFAPIVGAASGGGGGGGLLAVAGEAMMMQRMGGGSRGSRGESGNKGGGDSGGPAAQAARMEASGPAAAGAGPSGTQALSAAGNPGAAIAAGGPTGAAAAGGASGAATGASASGGAATGAAAAGAGAALPPLAVALVALKAADAARKKAGDTVSEWSQS